MEKANVNFNLLWYYFIHFNKGENVKLKEILIGFGVALGAGLAGGFVSMWMFYHEFFEQGVGRISMVLKITFLIAVAYGLMRFTIYNALKELKNKKHPDHICTLDATEEDALCYETECIIGYLYAPDQIDPRGNLIPNAKPVPLYRKRSI